VHRKAPATLAPAKRRKFEFSRRHQSSRSFGSPRSLRISPTGSRCAHACKTAQVRVLPPPPKLQVLRLARSLRISPTGSRCAHACKTAQPFESSQEFGSVATLVRHPGQRALHDRHPKIPNRYFPLAGSVSGSNRSGLRRRRLVLRTGCLTCAV
jgi:hypothetical protein